MFEKMMRLYRELIDRMENFDRRLIRLEGVQGPERHLVGESRSDGPASDVEEAEPGRRGVGKIVERDELLRHIEEERSEAHRIVNLAHAEGIQKRVFYARGKRDALAALYKHVESIAEERSDLPNDQAEPSAAPEN